MPTLRESSGPACKCVRCVKLPVSVPVNVFSSPGRRLSSRALIASTSSFLERSARNSDARVDGIYGASGHPPHTDLLQDSEELGFFLSVGCSS